MTDCIFVGCDLHDKTLVNRIAVNREAREKWAVGNSVNGRAKLIERLKQRAASRGGARIVFAYEASGQGFILCDQLRAAGIDCFVLAPTKIERSSQDKRNKNDDRDADRLLDIVRGHVLAGTKMPAVWVPDLQTRDERETVRTRLDLSEKQTGIKAQIQTLLKRHGVERPDHVGRPMVDSMDAEKGVGRLTAVAYATEVGDFTRFRRRQQIGAYWGISPSSNESGENSDRKGHITRQGSPRMRRLLCQAAWSRVQHDEAEKEVYQRLVSRNPKRKKIALVAAMRRLSVRLWHVGRDAQLKKEA